MVPNQNHGIIEAAVETQDSRANQQVQSNETTERNKVENVTQAAQHRVVDVDTLFGPGFKVVTQSSPRMLEEI